MSHSLPPSFIFEVGTSDETNDNQFYFNPVTISNGCILNSDISIASVLRITSTLIKCEFANTEDIPASDELTILVLSVSVLEKAASSQPEYMKTMYASFYTQRAILISKSNRGRKMIY